MPLPSPYRFKVGDLIRTPEVTYRVEENLGYGGMGEAHRVKNRALNDDRVVLKMMHAELAHDSEARESFAWEARAGRQIRHENLARVEWLGNLDDAVKTPYLLMEYVDGKTLRYTLKEVADGRIEVVQALTIGGQMLRGLGALHERGIVHQDMKPSNVMLCRGPYGDLVKLLDLGVMRVLSVHGDTRTWAGTPPYSAREQIVGEPVGAWTDLFAVSVMLFEMLAGETPYAKYGVTPAGAIARMDVEAPSLDGHGAFPTAIVALVAKGLAVRSADRFRTASEMEIAVEKALRELKSGNPHEAVTKPNLAGPPREGDEQGELGAVQLAGPTNEMNLQELHARMGLDAGTEHIAPPAPPASEPASPYAQTKPSVFGQVVEEPSTAPVPAASLPTTPEPRVFRAIPPTAPEAPAPPPVASPAPPPVGGSGARKQQQHTVPMPRGPRISVLDAVTAPNQHAPLSAPISDGRVQYIDRPPVQNVEIRGPAPTSSPVASVVATALRVKPLEHRVAAPAPTPTRPSATSQHPRERSDASRQQSVEPLLARVRERVRALRQSIDVGRRARRDRSAVVEREKIEAEKRARRAKALARAERVEAGRVAQVARERELEERELADKQRQVEANRRRIREAEARGERWTGEEKPRRSVLVQLCVAAVVGVLVVLGILSVPAVQRRLSSQEVAPPSAPAARSGR